VVCPDVIVSNFSERSRLQMCFVRGLTKLKQKMSGKYFHKNRDMLFEKAEAAILALPNHGDIEAELTKWEEVGYTQLSSKCSTYSGKLISL
jgi:hypothetical protein